MMKAACVVSAKWNTYKLHSQNWLNQVRMREKKNPGVKWIIYDVRMRQLFFS